MPLISWTEDYAIGVPAIDKDHQQLFLLANRFHDAYKAHHDKTQILSLLRNLILYAETHFRREEQHMEQIDYPESEAHKKAHDQFIEQVFRLQEEYESGVLRLSDDVMDFIGTWLSRHILETDQKLKAHH